MEKNGKFQNLIRSPLISSKSVYLTPEKVKKCFVKYGFWIVGQTMIFKKSAFKKLDIKFNQVIFKRVNNISINKLLYKDERNINHFHFKINK
mgnify:CR=1 FL=1